MRKNKKAWRTLAHIQSLPNSQKYLLSYKTPSDLYAKVYKDLKGEAIPVVKEA